MPGARVFGYRWLLALCALALPVASLAQSTEPAVGADGLRTTILDTVVVSGELPGPGLWRVSKDGRELWILGTLAPLPKRMEWNSREVEQRIAAADQVLLSPGVSFNSGLGMFRSLLLLPSLLKARNNPEGKRLQETLSPELYARWQALKQVYMPRSRGIEKRRPIVAAEKLQDKALRRADLSMDTPIAKVVRKAAKRHDVPLVESTIEITLKDPKGLLKEFNATALQDTECFARILTRLESDIETLKLRANAWALGEIGILRQLPYTDAYRACANALLENELAQRHGFGDLEARLREVWLATAEQALTDKSSSFATLPMSLILRDDGYVAELARRGYRVEPPDSDRPAASEAVEVEVDAQVTPEVVPPTPTATR